MTGKTAVALGAVLICGCAVQPSDTETLSIRVSEGTMLSFDASADGRFIVFDLLGQLWLMPAEGGEARALTDAVRDTAEDLDPSFSPDGQLVAFRAERSGRTGLWLLDIESGNVRQLTQLAEPDGYDGSAAWSPDGKFIAFEHMVSPDATHAQVMTVIALHHVDTGAQTELRIDGLPDPNVHQPSWSADGTQIAFISGAEGHRRIWVVDGTGGRARPVSDESLHAYAPAFSPDGRRLAFIGRDSAGRAQIWVQEIGASARQLTEHDDVAPTRVRWSADGSTLSYSADGRLWRIAAHGGEAVEFPFSAQLTLTRARRRSQAATRLTEPGKTVPARAFTSLSLSTDGRSIAAIALGKLWILPVGGEARAIASVPHSARHLAWSRSAPEVVWSAGSWNEEDLFATDLTSGATRQITRLPGREMLPTYSPDGREFAFVHADRDAVLRVVDAQLAVIDDTAQTRNLGVVNASWTASDVEVPQWTPTSDAIIVSNDWIPRKPTTATLISLAGARDTITYPDAPIFLRWLSDNSVVFVRHDRLWQAPFDRSGMLGRSQPLGNAAALYASAADDGTVLYISEDGLRLRAPSGSERRLGWPISFTTPLAAPLLIRNARIIDVTRGAATLPQDILVTNGRIERIAEPGAVTSKYATEIDAEHRFVMPGLIDLHAHIYRPDLLPGFLYFGVTTMRDQGAAIAPLVAYAEMFAAGVLAGPRVAYGGFQYYSDWPFDEDQGRGIEPEADAEHVERSVALAAAFGAQHVKTRTFRRWDINARMIAEAHRRGMRATGHCAHPLPLVAAGIDAKEHIGLCAVRGNGVSWPFADMTAYDDIIQLFRAAGIPVVPTISYFSLAAQLSADTSFLDHDRDLTPFMPEKSSLTWMTELGADERVDFARAARQAGSTAVKLARGGVTIGAGTDIWQLPTAIHMELQALVAAGFSPGDAIRAATADAARVIGAEAEIGTIEPGKWADLVILDANPLSDIRNTRSIWSVVQNGHIVDRAALRQAHGQSDATRN